MIALLECFVAQVAEMGVKGAMECVHPAAGKAVDLCRGVWQKWHERRKLDQMRAEVAKLAQMTADQVAAEVRAELNRLAPDQPQAVVDLELYLSMMPGVIRQSLKRADDPDGRSVPIDLQLAGPADLVRLFPASLPQMRPGAALPGLSSWTLTRLLGAGGFGEVWLATHAVDVSRRSAVKFCTDPAAKLSLLEHELKQVVRLMRAGGHPNLVPLLEYSLSDHTPWLMYEYVGGGTLADQILTRQRGEPAERVAWAVGALSELTAAVAHLHRLAPPLVHRDLKPANVLCCADTGRLRVTDLGLGGSAVEYALSAESQGYRSVTGRLPSLLFGSHSLHYASPEQRSGSPPDPRDDVHALGVIAYQMLTGKLDAAPGFDADDDLCDAGTPDDLIALIGRCIARKAERRPKDATEVAEVLVNRGSDATGGQVTRIITAAVRQTPPQRHAARTQQQTQGQSSDGGWEPITIPLRGRWWAMTPSSPKPAWKAVCDTPADVPPTDGEVYRLELSARTTDADLSRLRSLGSHPFANRITRVDLSGCESVTDSGLSHLVALGGLQHVNGYGCRGITDAGLAHLSNLPRLVRLDLTRCGGITDAGLAHLIPLTELEYLTLGGCDWITDAGLVHLAKVKSLKAVSVRGTQVSEAGAERLRRAVPGCNVEM
jgi:serine/threonine protein kinase